MVWDNKLGLPRQVCARHLLLPHRAITGSTLLSCVVSLCFVCWQVGPGPSSRANLAEAEAQAQLARQRLADLG